MFSFELLKQVNSEINALPYIPEVGDDWTPALTGGDCDSYATRKMEELSSRGIPVSSMRLATAWVDHAQSGYHAVLLVDHDGQTYVLDNRYPHPMEYQMVPYKWHKLMRAGTRDWELAL